MKGQAKGARTPPSLLRPKAECDFSEGWHAPQRLISLQRVHLRLIAYLFYTAGRRGSARRGTCLVCLVSSQVEDVLPNLGRPSTGGVLRLQRGVTELFSRQGDLEVQGFLGST